MHEDIVSLETRLAFQENMIEELNKIVYRQQTQLDFIMERFPMVLEKLKYVEQGQNVQAASEEAPPPHY